MKNYNITQTAKKLHISRQGFYYWIKKGWVKPRRNHCNYPIFTKKDIKKIKEWRVELKQNN